MTMPLKMLSASLLLLLATQTQAAYGDKDTCWDAPNWCITATSKWSTYDEGKLIVTYTNGCNDRVYLKMCNDKKNGRKDCGSTGLRGGKSTKWSTYDATGDYNWKFVGVLKGSNDWVCAGKVSGWRD